MILDNLERMYAEKEGSYEATLIFALSVKFLYQLKFAKSVLASITLGCLRAENRMRQGSRVGCCRW